jgi:hypothetical protein
MKFDGTRESAPRLKRYAVAFAAAVVLCVGFATTAYATPVAQTPCNNSGCHSGSTIRVSCFQASTTSTSTTYNIDAPNADAWAVFSAGGTDVTYAGGTNPRGTSGTFTVANGDTYSVFAVGGAGTTMGSTQVSPGGGSSSAATVTLTYTAGSGGTITGTTPQIVDMYTNGTAVTAVPDTGYVFVGWSDGVRTPTRLDTAVTADVDVEAVFETVITYVLDYSAGPGGTILGAAHQTATFGQDGSVVTAVPKPGYYFVGWSDGVTSASRTDEFVTSDTSATASFAAKKSTSVSLKSSRTSATHGAYVTLTAALRGGVPAGTTVAFQVKAPGKRSYATIGSAGTSSLGVALKKYKVASRGAYYFRVVFSGTTVFKASTSSAVKVASK